jgi:hypothetical protein
MPNQSSKNRIAALARKPKVDPEVSKQRLLDKLAPLRQTFNELPLGKAGKFVEVAHDCFPFNKYQHRYKDNGCSLWYLKTVLKNDVDEKFTFVDQHAPGEMGKGKGSVGKVLKLVISHNLYDYKLMRLAAEEEIAAYGGTLPESTPEHGDVDTTANVASGNAEYYRTLSAKSAKKRRWLAAEKVKEANRRAQRAIVEVKASILSEITELNKEASEIKAAKEALTAQALKNRANMASAINRLETQHRKWDELNATKEE